MTRIQKQLQLIPCHKHLHIIIISGIQRLSYLAQMNFEINKAGAKHHKYREIREIGSGNFGFVYLVESQLDNKKYIVKKLKHNGSLQTKQTILKQIQVMKSLKHQYIIQYHQSFKEERNISIVMEYAQKGDLQSYLAKRQKSNHPLTQEQVLEWFIQLCLGLKYIHQRMIVHRDLKAENIFINQNHELKIGDFGISRVMTGTFDLSHTVIGTLNVISPQICEKKPYNQKTDIWSLGCVLYKMITFKYPFQAQNPGSYILKVSQGTYAPILGDYSQEIKQLVSQLLNKQPHCRPSVQKILSKNFIKKHVSQVLDNTFMKLDIEQKQNTVQSGTGKQSLDKSPIQKKYMRKSLSSLSAASLLNSKTPKNQSLKLVEFKQSYPILVEQNKVLKTQLNSLKQQREKFEESINTQIQAILKDSTVSKQEAVQRIKNNILLYIYQ